MPLIACSTDPPRPCQNVLCRRRSVTRAGSSARSPIRKGRSNWTAPCTSALLVKTLPQANLVPQAAIQHNNDVAFVYVVQSDSTVRSSNVKILATEGDLSAVTGVNPGDQLVSDGFDKLQNGSKIARRPAAPASTGAAAQKAG